MSNQNNQTGMTTEQLLEIVKAIKAPAEPTEAQQAIMANDLVARKQRGSTELEKIQNRKNLQAACDHTRIENGTSSCVHIFGNNSLNDYMICQGCQGMIHAGNPPADAKLAQEMLDNGHIFDTRLFNRHYLMTARQTTF